MIKFFKYLLILINLALIVTQQTFADSKVDISIRPELENDIEKTFEETNDQNRHGPQIAKIIVPRAVVYADENLISPLGYIGNGKLIHVGNIRRVLNHELVPTVISGRLAYIEAKDIEYIEEKIEEKNSKLGRLKEHNIDIVLKSPEERLNENNSAFFGIGRFYGGEELKNAVYQLEGTDASWLTSLSMTFIHRSSISRFFWGAGFEHNWISSNDMSYKMFIIAPNFGYTLLRNPIFSLEAFFNYDFSTGSYFNIENNYSDDPSGFAMGPQFGVRIITTPSLKYKFYGGLSYRLYNVFNAEKLRRIMPDDINFDEEIDGVTAIRGIGLSFGLCFDL